MDILNAAVLAHSRTTLVLDDCDALLDCSEHARREDTDKGHSCHNTYCVCDVVKSLVELGFLVLVDSPVHDRAGQCFARFAEPVYEQKKSAIGRLYQTGQSMQENAALSALWRGHFQGTYQAAWNSTKEARRHLTTNIHEACSHFDWH